MRREVPLSRIYPLSLYHGRLSRAMLIIVWTLAMLGAAPMAVLADAAAEQILYGPVLPDQRGAVIAETAERLSHYQISTEVELPTDDQPSRLTGEITLQFVNDGPVPRDEVYFRLYGNDSRYAEGEIELRDVEAGGVPIDPELSVENTVARLPLPEELGVGEMTEIRYGFVTTVPTSPRQSYGIFSYQPDGGTLVLAQWFPILAGIDADGAWSLEPPSELGDVIFSNTALFEVAVTAPAGLVVVTTGVEVDREHDEDEARYQYVSGPVRDFAMVLDDDYESVSVEVDGTTVTSWYNPEHDEGGRAVLRYGVQALEIFNDLFGPYPYEEMDLVDLTVRNGAAGVEFPQLMFIGGDYYDRVEPGADGRPTFLETIVAHEVAHQWWYALVGNNQYQHAFIDEGLTNYLSASVYYERAYDDDVAEREVQAQLQEPYARRLISGGDAVVDQPTADFAGASAYGVIIYSKAALGFGAIREEIGDEAFFAALTAYYQEHRFDVATPEDLLAAFEAASNEELDELWQRWFEEAEGD
jgi:hypothetical protein